MKKYKQIQTNKKNTNKYKEMQRKYRVTRKYKENPQNFLRSMNGTFKYINNSNAVSSMMKNI